MLSMCAGERDHSLLVRCWCVVSTLDCVFPLGNQWSGLMTLGAVPMFISDSYWDFAVIDAKGLSGFFSKEFHWRQVVFI